MHTALKERNNLFLTFESSMTVFLRTIEEEQRTIFYCPWSEVIIPNALAPDKVGCDKYL